MLLAATCSPPAVVKRVDPRAPVPSDAHGVTVNAGIGFVLMGDGTVSSTHVVRSTGIPLLDKAAADAVKQWRFSPPAPGCEANSAYVVSVTFRNIPVHSPYDSCSHDTMVLYHHLVGYPNEARGFASPGEHTVLVLVKLDANGSPTSLKIVKSAGIYSMDAAALAAARFSIYAPKVVACKPVESEQTFTVVFESR